MMPRHNWKSTLAFGDQAAEAVANALRARGSLVVDVTKLPAAQRRGVDYLVDEEYVDIKADNHAAKAIFLELECKGQTGCFYKSRADAWLYYFPKEGKLYRLDLPALQLHLARHLDRYQQRSAWSRAGSSEWSATGAIVPLQFLLDLGIAQDVSDWMTTPTTKQNMESETAV